MFDHLDPARTAHIIVDLQSRFMEPGAAVEIPQAREIVPNINRIGAAVRAAGDLNVFIRHLIDEAAITQWSTWFTNFATPDRRKAMNETFCRGCHDFDLWPELEVQVKDSIVDKTRFGAFVPGSYDLHDILQAREINTLIITGTAPMCAANRPRDADELQGHLRR
jgi:ureidoacrylate peracid hydrolase